MSAVHDVLLTVYVSGLRKDGYPTPRDNPPFRLISAAEYHLYLKYRSVFITRACLKSIGRVTDDSKNEIYLKEISAGFSVKIEND